MSDKKKDYSWILDEYPPVITKNQLYQICKVSKKTAQHYLENGLIPCVNSGKKTRKYTIRTVDVVDFLQRRDQSPLDFVAPEGWYKSQLAREQCEARVLTSYMAQKVKRALSIILDTYPDLLTVKQASDITSISDQTFLRWIAAKKLFRVQSSYGYRIPKVCFFEFLTKDRCRVLSTRAKYREHVFALASQIENRANDT